LPSLVKQSTVSRKSWVFGDGDAHRPPRTQHLRPVRYRQADRGRQGAISFACRAVGRHRHQHRAADAGRTRRLGGRGARSYPYPDGRGQKPRQGSRAADGPETEILTEAQQDEAPTATGRGRNPRGISAQLRRGKEHDFAADDEAPAG
jgi:hypothetical protein